MKTLVAIMVLLITSQNIFANAISSIYRGEQFKMDGALLFQDADSPHDFYVMPTRYVLKRNGFWDYKEKKVVETVDVINTVETINGEKYSVYRMNFELDTPGEVELTTARSALSSKLHQSINLRGIPAVCGLQVASPAFTVAAKDRKASLSQTAPGATLVSYEIDSTETEECNSELDPSEISVTYAVPLAQEPAAARVLMSKTGLTLPPIKVRLKAKYTDSVEITVNTASALEQLRAGADIAGTFEEVTAGVKASIEQVITRQRSNGLIKYNCEKYDSKVCGEFMDMAKDIMAKEFYIFNSEATKGDTTPLVVSDDSKGTGGLFRAHVGIDFAKVDREKRSGFKGESTVFTSFWSGMQVQANELPKQNLDPQVLKTFLVPDR